jgi:hypothetical protein
MCCRSDGINDGEAAGGDGREGGRERKPSPFSSCLGGSFDGGERGKRWEEREERWEEGKEER